MNRSAFHNFGSHRFIFDFIANRKSGILIFTPGIRKLFFENGELVYASSEVPREHFSKILVEQGIISEDRLEKVKEELGEGRAVGKALRDQGLVENAQLAAALKQQITRIVEETLLLDEGDCEVVDQLPAKLPHLKIHTVGLIIRSLLNASSEAFVPDYQPDMVFTLSQGATGRAQLMELPDGYNHILEAVAKGEQTPQDLTNYMSWDNEQIRAVLYAFEGLQLLQPSITSEFDDQEDLLDETIIDDQASDPEDAERDQDALAPILVPTPPGVDPLDSDLDEDENDWQVEEISAPNSSQNDDDAFLMEEDEGDNLDKLSEIQPEYSEMDNEDDEPSISIEAEEDQEDHVRSLDLDEDEDEPGLGEDTLPGRNIVEEESDLPFEDEPDERLEEIDDTVRTWDDSQENDHLQWDEETKHGVGAEDLEEHLEPLPDGGDDHDDFHQNDIDHVGQLESALSDMNPEDFEDDLEGSEDLDIPDLEEIDDEDDEPLIPRPPEDHLATLPPAKAISENPFEQKDNDAFSLSESDPTDVDDDPFVLERAPTDIGVTLPDHEEDADLYMHQKEKGKKRKLFLMVALPVLVVAAFFLYTRQQQTTTTPEPNVMVETATIPNEPDQQSPNEESTKEIPSAAELADNDSTNQVAEVTEPEPTIDNSVSNQLNQTEAPTQVPTSSTDPSVVDADSDDGPLGPADETVYTGEELAREDIDLLALDSKQAFVDNGGAFSVSLMVACVPRTIRDFKEQFPNETVYVIPKTLGERDCWVICWGAFESKEDAFKEMEKIPPAFYDPNDPPRIVDLRPFL